MTSNLPRYFYSRIKDRYGDYFGIKDRHSKKQIACTIYWQTSPSQQVAAQRDAARIVAALNAHLPDQATTACHTDRRYIYGPESEGVNDLFVVQDAKTRRDLACAVHWGEGEEIEAERIIVQIMDALNAYRPAKKRRA
jgi:hypothetical protein